MAQDAKIGNNGAATSDAGKKTKHYGLLTIENRLLVTDDTTIAIPQIARFHISGYYILGTNGMAAWAKALLTGAIVTSLFGFFGLNTAYSTFEQLLYLALILVSVGAAVFALKASHVQLSKDRQMHYLNVVTADGGTLVFRSPYQDTIDSVRRLISDKINEPNDHSSVFINFEKGTIENISGAQIGSVGAVVNGNNNTVTAATGTARAGTTEYSVDARQSMGAQIGTGNIAVNNTYRIDYKAELPIIESWRSHFERDPSMRHVADQLARLEELLRAGAPTSEEKSKLKSVLSTLSEMFRGTNAALDLFRKIGEMAGLAF